MNAATASSAADGYAKGPIWVGGTLVAHRAPPRDARPAPGPRGPSPSRYAGCLQASGAGRRRPARCHGDRASARGWRTERPDHRQTRARSPTAALSVLHMTIGDIRLARHQHRRAGRTRRANRIDHGAAVVHPSRRCSSRSSDPARQRAAEPLGQRCRGGAGRRLVPGPEHRLRHRDHDSPGRCRRDIAIRSTSLATSGSTGR